MLISGNDFVEKKPIPSEKWEKKIEEHKVSDIKVSAAVGSESAKQALCDLVEKNKNEYEYELEKNVEKVLSHRHDEADRLFNGICDRAGSFVKNHIKEIGSDKIIKEAMQRELFTQETLDNYLIATALELDSALFNTINGFLDGELKKIDFSDKNYTYNELKAMMPDVRAICEDIYNRFNNHMLKQPQLNLYNKISNDCAEKAKNKYGSKISEGAIKFTVGLTIIAASQFIPVVGQVVGAGVALVGAFVAGWGVCDAAVGFTVDTVADVAQSIYNEKISNYIVQFKQSILETRDIFKKSLGMAAKKILESYKKVPQYIIENGNISIEPDLAPSSIEFSGN